MLRITRLRFRLRTLFTVVAVFACLASVVKFQLRWIDERHAFLAQQATLARDLESRGHQVSHCRTNGGGLPPGGLWMYRERGMGFLQVLVSADEEPVGTEPSKAERDASRLFPEARLTVSRH